MNTLLGELNHGDLPEDVTIEILMRLPVKAILRFKCVCKHWYHLITSPSFVREHYNHKSNQERLLVRHYRPDTEQYAFALYLDETLCMFEEPDHLQMPSAIGALMGPVDGVFCVVGVSRNMALLNPSTRQFRPLPLVHQSFRPHLSSFDNLVGFGLDPSTGDYKIVWIQYFWNDEMDVAHYPSLVSVYNSGSDSWRNFEDVNFVNSSRCAYKSLSNTYLNGVYYWLTELNDTDISVLAFSMCSETFQEIHVPDCIKSKEGDLALYDDSIAIITCDLDSSDKFVEVWVMQDGECWAKSLKIGPFDDIKWPLGFWRNGELLLETGMLHLALYSMNAKSVRTLETRRKENGFFIYWVFSYKESLASFIGKDDKCMQWDTSSDSVKDFLENPSSNR